MTLEMGESGVEVSRIGLGGFELGPEQDATPDVDRAVAVAETALAAGINWIDTSESYHDRRNESLIGEALRRTSAEMLVATKVAPVPDGSGLRAEQIRSACQGSLERLHRDRIDIYFLHWPDETGIPLEETWGAMAELVDEGLVRAIGLSNYSTGDIERCHAQRRVDAIQDGLSLIDYLRNRELFARCGAMGIAGVVFEPLGSGVLTGRTIDQVRESWAAYTDWSFYKRLLEGENGDRSGAVVEGIRAIGAGLDATVAQVAIGLGPAPGRRRRGARRKPQRRAHAGKCRGRAAGARRPRRAARGPHPARGDNGDTPVSNTAAIADLLHEAAETHHVVYRIVDDDDPDWGVLVCRLAPLPLRAAAAARRSAGPQPPRPLARPARPRLHLRGARGTLGGLVRRAARGGIRRLADRPGLAAERRVGVGPCEELRPARGDVGRSGRTAAQRKRCHERPAQADPELLVERVPARAVVHERGERGQDHRRQLEAAVGVPRPVLGVDVPDRVRHHTGESTRAERSEEAEG
jgi:aryl-alcohol dehydrogenase-like predicted oxidoreductase